MYDPNAFHLFDLNGHDSIHDAIHPLNTGKLQETFYHEIVYRGEFYYLERAVKQVEISPQKISAIISGTENYQTSFYVLEDKIMGTCNCPYDGPCKHQVALAYYLIRGS